MKQRIISTTRIGGVCLLIASLMLGCGSQTGSDRAPAPELPQTVQTITHPDLKGLEPQAAQQVEAQKNVLEGLLIQKETPQADLAQAYGKMGMLYYSFRYKGEAEIALLNARLLEPAEPRWNYFLAHLYAEQNQPDKSLYFFEEAHRLAPENVPAMIALADVLRRGDKPEKAKALFEKALAVDSLCVPALTGLGHLAAAEKDQQKASEYFLQALGSQPRATSINYPLALAYQALGKTEEAERHMALRGDIEPFLQDLWLDEINNPRALAHYRMGETLRVAGKNDEAIAHYDLVVQLDPVNVGARMGRVLNLIKLRRYFDAAFVMQDDLSVFPSNPIFGHLLARLSAASPDDTVRDGKRALRILEMLKQGGVTAEMTETLAMAFAEVEQFDNAVLAQEKAIEMATQAGDEEFAAKMAKNLALYKNKQPCRTPWEDDDPLLTMITYGK